MNISELKSKALSSLDGKWGLVVGLTFMYFMLTTVLVSGVEILLSGSFEAWNNSETKPLVADLTGVAISILLIPFYIGVYWFYLSLVRGEKPKIGDAFATYGDFKMSVKLLGTSVVSSFYILLWSLLLVIPGIIKTFSYSQMFYLLRDHPEYGINEAITESRKRMDGLKTRYFLMVLSFLGWAILASLTLGIGYLWLIPYYSATMAAFYNENIADNATEYPVEENS